jgi:hypothetical protein
VILTNFVSTKVVEAKYGGQNLQLFSVFQIALSVVGCQSSRMTKVVASCMKVLHAHNHHMAIKTFKMIKYVMVIVLLSG